MQDVQSLLMKDKNCSWCTVCGYKASSNNDVTRHITAKHLNLRLECKFCHVVLRTRLNLQRHLKKKHGQTRENINEIMTYHLEETDFDTDTSLLQ